MLERLKELLKKQDLTLGELSEKTGLSLDVLNGVMKDKAVSFETFSKIYEALHPSSGGTTIIGEDIKNIQYIIPECDKCSFNQNWPKINEHFDKIKRTLDNISDLLMKLPL